MSSGGSADIFADVCYEEIAKIKNTDWLEFARRKLNIPDSEIDDITTNYRHDIREQKFQMLQFWKSHRKNRDCNPSVALRKLVASTSEFECTGPAAEGGNGNHNFENCYVDQINVYNNTSTEGEASRPSQKEYSALVDIVNANTRQKTTDKILDDFKTEDLHRPDFQVNPCMRKVKVKDYFKGNYQNVEDMEVSIKKRTWLGIKREKVLKTQLRKEVGFHGHKEKDEYTLSLDQLIMSITGETNSSHTDEHSVIGIVASAGSGKTTLLRRLARKSLDTTSLTQGSNQVVSKMIHFIELKTIQYAGNVKPSTFLFGGLFRNESDEQNAYQWLLENQTNAVLYFDGLDQATWKIGNGAKYNKINSFSHADTATIMYNILSGNLFPQAKIVVASREFRVSELPAEARPTDIITLSGFTQNDAQKLFVFLIGKDGPEAWGNIRSMSPRLLNLVSVPVFLILTAVVMARDLTRPLPTTVTELYRRIIAALQRVENIRQRDNIDKILLKLKEMAYRGMEEGRVVFYAEDLQKLGLSTEEVQDLIMKVPDNNLLSRHLIEGDFIFFFCHQSIQEFLAANFIVHMTARKFSRFDGKHLHEDRWSVVRRFVSGLVYEQLTDQLYKIPDQMEKQRILTRSLRSKLEKKKYKDSNMELYTTIYESDDDDLMKHVDFISVDYFGLSRDQAHVVGTLVARSQGLDALDFFGCQFRLFAEPYQGSGPVRTPYWLFIRNQIQAKDRKTGDEMLDVIGGCVKHPVHVKEVNLFGSSFSTRALRSFLGHPRIESWSGNIHWKVIFLNVGENVPWLLDEGDDVIRIGGVGRFNIQDSTLSFKKAPSTDEVKFLEELFDVRSKKDD